MGLTRSPERQAAITWRIARGQRYLGPKGWAGMPEMLARSGDLIGQAGPVPVGTGKLLITIDGVQP